MFLATSKSETLSGPFTILNYTDFLGSEWHKGEKMTEC